MPTVLLLYTQMWVRVDDAREAEARCAPPGMIKNHIHYATLLSTWTQHRLQQRILYVQPAGPINNGHTAFRFGLDIDIRKLQLDRARGPNVHAHFMLTEPDIRTFSFV